MISEIKNLRFSQPHWYTCLSLTAACHTDVPACVCVCARVWGARQQTVTETMRNKQKPFRVSVTIHAYGEPVLVHVRMLLCRCPPVCWRLCLVRACLVPPAKPHMSHRYVFSPRDGKEERIKGWWNIWMQFQFGKGGELLRLQILLHTDINSPQNWNITCNRQHINRYINIYRAFLIQLHPGIEPEQCPELNKKFGSSCKQK